jgi:hypothetical protein
MKKKKPVGPPHMQLLGYMLHRGAIGRHVAASHFNVWDLPQQIHKLKKKGYAFTKKGAGKDLTYTINKDTTSSPNINSKP